MKRSLVLLLLVAISLTVNAQTTIKMVVNEVPKTCRRMMEQVCLQVQKDGSEKWEMFYDDIKGFKYQAGFRYTIIVIVTKRPEPVPADLSKNLYKLDKIISQVAVPVSNKVAAWRVVSVNGKANDNDAVQLSFNEDLTKLSSKTACNSISGSSTFNEKKSCFKTTNFIATLMACDPKSMEQEQELTKALSNKSFKLSTKNGQWVWKAKKTVIVLESVPVELITRQENSPWDYFSNKKLKVIQLNGSNDIKSDQHLIIDNRSLSFAGNNGCNQIHGSFKVKGEELVFTSISSTKKMCVDQELARAEKEMMLILNQKVLRVDFAEQVMNIYDVVGNLVIMLAIDNKPIPQEK